ncbi:hypothetical protein [Celeribacter litoreus]|uniref:hypothetical protein n=1 Tax=Celeribacter litoreus TaxID=2876714 RepID=UPI001CCAD9D9|nr:hypothetical protein [Celeribacter litoreus]MCA0044303.1 hypothetical protein [Celeribacter litoreus]
MTEGWADILMPNERVLWQAQPDSRIEWRGPQVPFALFGMMFAGFALFWTVKAMMSNGFWVYGIFQIVTGLGIALAPLFIGPFIAKRTWYSLTNRRAFFASDLPFGGKSLTALELYPNTPVEFDGQEPGTLSFGARAEALVGDRFDSTPRFFRIPNARHVFGLVLDIQKGKV